jgi:hypothetical protein
MPLNCIASVFRTEWSRHHEGRHPAGWLLRQHKDLPWVRFHALPDSKRYAETEIERQIILTRGNRLGDRLLGAGTSCWLVGLNTCETERAWVDVGEYLRDEGGHQEFLIRFSVQAVQWRAGAFDAILTSVADDDARYLWVNRLSGAIFAPYDGGFDLFSPVPDEVAALKTEMTDWLPCNPSGL